MQVKLISILKKSVKLISGLQGGHVLLSRWLKFSRKNRRNIVDINLQMT